MKMQRSRRGWLEPRRRRAIELLHRHWKQSEVAEALGVSKGAVSQWVQVYRRRGLRGLQSIPRAGAPRRLTPGQRDQIPELLWHGAEAHGFRGNLWTCRRIAVVIEREFGVRYHRHHVAKLMRELNWTPHQPVPRATQRNEVEIRAWRNHRWVELKKSPKREKKPISAG